MATTFNSSGPVSLGSKFLKPICWLAGVTVGSNGLFYGGASNTNCTGLNTVTRINTCRALVGSLTTVSGASGVQLARGAGFN